MSYIGQAEDEWEYQQEKKRIALKKKNRTRKPTCPYCGTRLVKEDHYNRCPHLTKGN